jgi:hypothetical protein
MGVAGGSAAVIVGSYAGGFGQRGIRPPVASIAQVPVGRSVVRGPPGFVPRRG